MHSIKISKSNLPPCSMTLLDNQLVIGTYNLDASTGSRTGSLDLYDLDLNLLRSTPIDSAVLDTKSSRSVTYTAHSSGDVKSWDKDLNNTNTVKLENDSLITQIELRNDRLAATTTTGNLIVYNLETQTLDFIHRIHNLEAWTVAWHSDHTLLTGGDDRQLSFTDLRLPSTLWKIKPHDAGVTSILPRYENGKDNELLTGGYDDCLKVLDLRMKRVTHSQQLSGGVWRLIPNKINTRILACCMYGGLQILKANGKYEIESELTNHDSMVYGGAWLDNDTGITCSFYDYMLQKWRV